MSNDPGGTREWAARSRGDGGCADVLISGGREKKKKKVYKKKKIDARARARRGQVEATALTSPQVSILTLLLLRYWIQLRVGAQRPADVQRFSMSFLSIGNLLALM